MKKVFKNDYAKSLLISGILCFIVLMIVSPISCRLTEEGIEIIPADTNAPSILSFSVTGERLLNLSCSEKIVLDQLTVREFQGESSDEGNLFLLEEEPYAYADCITYSENMMDAEIYLSESTRVGKEYVLSGIVYDRSGNSLEFSQQFSGFNANPARLVLSEVRYNSSKPKKTEFVEFYVLKSGNLSGLEFVSAANPKRKYVFPAIEVKRGEYIALHGQVYDGMEYNAIDELENDLTLSTATESCDTGRELWRKFTDKFVSKTDVILLRDSCKNKIMDALLWTSVEGSEWSKNLKELAEEVQTAGFWENALSPENAVRTETIKSSAVKSLARQNILLLAEKYPESEEIPDVIPANACDWAIASSATPGYKNK